MDNVTCPFCDQVISTTGAHPSNLSDCPLDGYAFGIAKWNMRPPKKEQPAVMSEVEYLRGLLEKLILKEPAKPPYTGLRGDLRSELFKTIGPGEVK